MTVKEKISAILVVVEAVLTAIPFLLSWWLCAVYRSVLAGWTVSGLEYAEKRKALHQMIGNES